MQTIEVQTPEGSSGSPYQNHGILGNEKITSGYEAPRYSDAYDRPQPARKWSVQWVSNTWDRAVHLGRWPRILYGVLGVVIIIVWTVVMLSFANQEVKYQEKNLEDGSRQAGPAVAGGLVLLQGALKKFDPSERVLRIAWSGVLKKEDNSTVELGNIDDPNTVFPLSIYRDQVAVVDERYFDLSEELGYVPYRVSNLSAPIVANLGNHTWDGFDTEIDFAQAKTEDPWRQPLFGYPWDQWKGSVVFVGAVIDDERVNGTGAGVINLSGVLLTDSTLNWRINVEQNNTCNLPSLEAGCELHVDFFARRPPLVVFAALVAVIVNWISTISIFLLTCETVILRRDHIVEGTDMLSVCFTALFALPSVRSLLPGAPDFGAIIDLVGIIPNVIIISLCTTIIAIARLTTRRPIKRE